MRLHALEQTYGSRIRVCWRAFPMLTQSQPGRRSTPKTWESRRRAGAAEPGACFSIPAAEVELPASSVPALTAAKCAERQGEAAFTAFHEGLFAAYFHDHLDISQPPVLWRLAQQSGFDMERFTQDYAGEAAYQAVLYDYAEAVAWFGVTALPTVIFNEKVSLVGAIPVEHYRVMLDWLWAGEPGGMVPLHPHTPAPVSPGAFAVD